MSSSEPSNMSFGSWPPESVCSRSTSRCMYSASASTFLNSNAQNSGPRQSLDRCVAKSWFWMRVSIRRSELPVEVDSQMVVRAGESSHGCSASTLGSTARRARARMGTRVAELGAKGGRPRHPVGPPSVCMSTTCACTGACACGLPGLHTHSTCAHACFHAFGFRMTCAALRKTRHRMQ